MDNINYIDMPVSEFTAALASSSPAPGGGGASALAAALGASLGCMVGELTVGKPKYAANEPRLRELIAEAQSLRERLLTLVDADAEAFLPLAEAYRLPKDAPDRGAVMEKCLADAAAVTAIRTDAGAHARVEVAELIQLAGLRVGGEEGRVLVGAVSLAG